MKLRNMIEGQTISDEFDHQGHDSKAKGTQCHLKIPKLNISGSRLNISTNPGNMISGHILV